MKRLFGLVLSCFSCLLSAAELAPWFRQDLVFEPAGTSIYQQYSKISRGDAPSIRQANNDGFQVLSLGLSPVPEWDFQVEAVFALTRMQRPACDSVLFTGRYLIADDVAGESFFSTALGLTVIQAFEHSVHDISSFHHGKFEVEAHLALGKEVSKKAFWISRAWGVLGLGSADVGYPWLRADAAVEKNCFDKSRASLFVHSLFGFGNKNISSVNHFRGYGPIRHQSIDIGFKASRCFDIGAALDFEFAKRVFAKNFPKDANIIKVIYVYPIGVGNGFLGL